MKLSFYDPQNDPRLVAYIDIKSIAMQTYPYNFYSLLDFGTGFRVDNLYPDKSLYPLLQAEVTGDANTLAFDQAYCNQILTNEASFMDLMSILYGIETRDEVMIISNYTNRVIMPIVDSLIKFIQERYGIDSFIINELEDIDEFKFSSFATLEQKTVFMKDCELYVKRSANNTNPRAININDIVGENSMRYCMQRYGLV
jgi:hypothetical protein